MIKNILNKKTYSAILFLLIWQIVSLKYPPVILPSPVVILKSFYIFAKDSSFYYDLFITIYRGIFGYVLSIVLGITLATIFYINKFIKEIFYPYIVILQSIPRISWILLSMIWFPFNSTIVIFIILITILPTVVLQIFEGYENIDLELLDMARVFRIDIKRVVKDIYMPSISSYIIASAKISLGIMWKTVIMAELLTVQTGLGARMGYLRTSLATEQIIALTCVIVIINSLCQKILNIVYRRAERWKKPNGFNKNEQRI